MELEQKLASYRVKKNREARLNQFKENIKKLFTWNYASQKNSCDQKKCLINSKDEDEVITKVTNEISQIEPKIQSAVLKTFLYITGFIIWVYLYYLFIQMQFGLVYLTISALFGIYFNTRTGPKDENEVSAYSVFNKNCESIDGTLKAEQFEREIRFGAQSVH